MKKILFPTDFSEAADNAFVHALEFAKIVNAEIVVLHTFELPVYDNQFFPENYTVIYDSIQLSQYGMFKDEIPKLKAIAKERNLENIKLSHRLMDGDLIFNIKKSIKEDEINFVVMGTTGASGWETFFFGSNTENVLSTVNVPVLSVPLEAKFQKINTIGFTTRFRNKDKEALIKVLKIAKKTNASVSCLYVKNSKSDVSEATVKEWEEEFAGHSIRFFIIHNDDIEGAIIDFILFKDIDVLAMITYKRNFFLDLFNPSLTQKFSKNLDIPVLAMH